MNKLQRISGTIISSRFKHFANRFASVAIVSLGIYFLFPAITAQMQSADAPQQDDSTSEQLAPQAVRPDILWMRGGQSSASTGLTYIQNGQLLVSFSNDQVIKIFRVSDGILLRSIAVPDSLGSGDYNAGFAVSIDGQKVAIGTSKNGVYGIKIFSISNGSLLLSIPTNFAPLSISFSPVNNQIVAGALMGGNWNTAAMFDSVSGNLIRFIMHDSLRVGGYVAFSPDGQTFAAHEELGGGGGALALFNSSTGAWIKTYASIYGIVAFSPDGMKLATANGGNVTVFPALCAPGSCNAIFSGIAGNSNPAFSSDSQLLAINYNAANSSGRIRIFNTSNTSFGWSQNKDYVITQNGYNISYGTRLAFAPDNTLASAASQITLSNIGNGALIRNLTPLAYSSVPSLAFSSDGQTLATVNYNSVNSNDSIQLWNVAASSRRNITFPQSIGLSISQILTTPDQKLITLDNTGNPNNQHIKFWNAADGSLIRTIPLNTTFGEAVISVSPDGQIYTFSKSVNNHPTTYFYQTSDDSLIRTLNDTGGSGAFSPNNQLFASGQVTQSGNFNKIKIFDVPSGTELRTLNLSAILSRYNPNVAFSPDNQTIAVIEEVGGSSNPTGIIELFRVSDGTLLQTLGTFNSYGATVAFAPDGQTVIGTGYDTTVRIWRVSDGALLQTYDQETGVGTNVPLFQIAYSPDGSRFAYGRRDATVVMARNPYSSTPTATYTISGNITRNGAALAGVTVALSGTDSNGSMTTDASGNYSFTVNDGGSYTVTPSLTGNNFTPASQSFNFIAGNQTANFTAALVTHTISGNITRSGTALSGVIVNLSGSATGSATTDLNGNYSLTVDEGGNYTVTPQLSGNIFTPANRSFNNVAVNQTGNFTAQFSTYTISGNVKADGANLQSAIIRLTGTQSQMTTTDASGNYSFTANTNGSYTLTASQNGIVFSPASQTVTNLQSNQTVSFQNGAPLCAPAPSSLTAWYKGDGNTSDYSGNGSNGTLDGGTTFGTGKVGQAFNFDGVDDRVVFGDSPGNSPTSALTLDAWIKPSRVNQQQVFISKYNNFTSQNAFVLNSDSTGNKLEFRVYQTGDSGGGFKFIQTTNGVFSVNVWTHIAATFDTATQAMKIYVNGVDTPTIVITDNGAVTSIFDSIEPVRLGDFINGAGNHVLFFQGLIDEAQIYNRALSQAEIQNVYNAGSAGVCLISSFTGGGSLDETFNGTGKVTTPIRNGDDVGRSTVIQPDGKIIVVGSANNGSNLDFAVARYNADGSLDNSFGTNGKVTTAIGGSDDEAFSAAIQSDGKIVVSGYTIGGDADYALVRYNSNGSLDNSFGTNGKVTTAASSVDDYALGVAIQTDGKIVAGGFGRFGSADDFLVVRYNANGSLDISFGSGGIRRTGVSSSFDNANSVAIQTDGKIILAGYAAFGGQYDFAVVRYNTDGSLDAAFGSGGIVSTELGGSGDFADSVAIQTDGKIVVAGDMNSGANRDFAIARYYTDGSLDTTFGTNGRVITPIGSGLDIARSVKIQTDGKIVAAGVSSNGANDDFAVVRYNTNGSLDANFGSGGKVTTAIGSGNDAGNSVALQTDGKIVVAGFSSNGSNTDFAVVRYTTSGSVASQGSTYTPTSANGKIAFVSYRTGNSQIFTMNADGSGQTNISNNAADDAYGEWSPDGNKIVFDSFRNGNVDIYTMNADGTNQTRLTTNSTEDRTPAWSPDGTRIVFTSDRDNNNGREIYVMNADGTNQTRLTTSSGTDYLPKFSPDGNRIVFYSFRTGNDEIWLMNADGTNSVNLTNNTSSDYEPNWSPDGSKIAFRSQRSGNDEIWLMNANGSNPVNLSNNPATDFYPTFSPDGSKIAFASIRNGNPDIYVMNAADGSNQTRLTTDGNNDDYPSWQRTSPNVSVAPLSNINLTFSNVTQAGYTVATPLTTGQLPALPTGYTLPANSPMYDIRTSAGYAGNIIVSFSVPNIADSATCNNLRSLHFEGGVWTTATNGAPSYNPATQVCTVSQTVASLSPFVIAQGLAPTAANVSVGGRVLTAGGSGIRNVNVTLIDSHGSRRRMITTSFGYYRFDEVTTGETYVISVAAKKYDFSQPAQVRTVNENLTDIDFIADDNP